MFSNPSEQVLKQYNVSRYNYNLLIARLEPENNIDTILTGVVESGSQKPFLVIGKHETKYGDYLKEKFKENINIRFLGGIYNFDHLNNLRFYSNLYFHGHSVGGTNPSLLEAMGSYCLILANDNVFNRSILEDSAFYFNNANEVADKMKLTKETHQELVQNNVSKIKNEYSWNNINFKYEQFILECLKEKL